MSVATFIIQERPELGGFTPRAGAVRFEWDSDRRSSPIGGWPGGVTQRTSRTDYPGADSPTEQVLGPNYKPFTLNGRWKDKFNGGRPAVGDPPGFALKTFREFLAMVRRGNVVEISFQSLTFQGIITDFDWDYRREYDIGYTFTVSVHKTPGKDELTTEPSALTLLDASTLSARIEERIKTEMAAINDAKPETQLSLDASPITKALYEGMVEASDEFQTINSQRVLTTDPDSDLSVRRAVAAGDLVINRASAQLSVHGGLRADVSLMYPTPIGVLDFEVWNRGISATARLTVTDSFNARQQLDAQADPKAIALYKPFVNESLYSISNRFYGTPHEWRRIKQRNRLDSSNMTGTELLVIPEAPAQ